MRGTKSIFSLLVLLFFFCSCRSNPAVVPEKPFVAEFPVASLVAGAARVDIVTPWQCSLAGYGVRQGAAFEGIHDRPSARAIYVASQESPEQGIAVVSVDLLLISSQLKALVEDRVQNLGVKSFLLCATHSHSSIGNYSPNLLIKLAATGGYRPELLNFLADKIADSIKLAKASAKPARLGLARGEAPGLNVHRRDAKRATDSELMLLRFDEEARGKPLAYLCSYAAHPTALGPSNHLLSADFPGFLCRKIEAERGAVALFCNAAAAEIAPALPKGKEDFESARKIGESLAEFVFRLEKDLKTQSKVSVGARKANFRLPSVNSSPAAFFLFQPFVYPFIYWSVPEEAPLQVLWIGPVRLASFPCDFGVNLGRQLKERGGEFTIPVSYADSYIGYVVDEESYEQGWYESKLSFYGPHLGEFLVEASLSLFPRNKN